MPHAQHMGGKGRREKGFTLVEIMVVVGVIALLAAIAFPNFLKSRETTKVKLCIDNIRVLDGAKQQWALENKMAPSQTPSSTDIQPYLFSGKAHMPLCPSDSQQTFDTSYSLNNLTTMPECKALPSTHTFN